MWHYAHMDWRTPVSKDSQTGVGVAHKTASSLQYGLQNGGTAV